MRFRKRFVKRILQSSSAPGCRTQIQPVFGVNDREEQREIARWLGELKTARRIGPEIRLTFGEIDLWDDADVIWIR